MSHCVHFEVYTLPLFERITSGSWMFRYAVLTFSVDPEYVACPNISSHLSSKSQMSYSRRKLNSISPADSNIESFTLYQLRFNS